MKFNETNCECVIFSSTHANFALEPEQHAELERAELELILLYGSNWCHRDNDSPYDRLYSDFEGEHHTIGEWIRTKNMFESFLQRGW